MDVFESLTSDNRSSQIRAIGMHTAGEPTRIIIQGFPPLAGRTLLEKGADAKDHYDDVRRRLMHEPRGHNDMYGAILIQTTELVESGQADIGVLFCHNEGFSTMCGHATLALGRFLIDTHDTTVFPRRGLLHPDPSHSRISLTVHAPCGPVNVSVPVISTSTTGSSQINMRSDPSRSVWFLSVPSFATAMDLIVHIPGSYRWPELIASKSQAVKIDIAFGGAFYAFVSVEALGFPTGESLDVGLKLGSYSLSALTEATRLLKKYLAESPEFKTLLRHPTSPELEYLYGVIVTDPPMATVSYSGSKPSENHPSDVNICFFADQQIDRSPCGSGVSARVALAIAKGERQLEDPWTYHSLITKRNGGDAFTARGVKHVLLDHDNRHFKEGKWEAVVVKVEGRAYYTDVATFVLEKSDSISRDGFMLQ